MFPERTPVDRTLDWAEQRKKWNAEGFCAREACGGPHAGHVYKDHHALKYCTRCARLLVAAQGDVIAWGHASLPEDAGPGTRHELSMGASVPGPEACSVCAPEERVTVLPCDGPGCPLCDMGAPSRPMRTPPQIRLPAGFFGVSEPQVTIPVGASAMTPVSGGQSDGHRTAARQKDRKKKKDKNRAAKRARRQNRR